MNILVQAHWSRKSEAPKAWPFHGGRRPLYTSGPCGSSEMIELIELIEKQAQEDMCTHVGHERHFQQMKARGQSQAGCDATHMVIRRVAHLSRVIKIENPRLISASITASTRLSVWSF